ncbi:MAG: hypothetical protein ACUVQG_07180 [Thermogutta sp.]
MNQITILLCYLVLAVANAVGLVAVARQISRHGGSFSVWVDVANLALYTTIGLVGALATGLGHLPGLPLAVKDIANELITPPALTAIWFIGIVVLLWKPEFLASGWVFWHSSNWVSFWFLLSLADRHFARLVLTPDHIAVVFLVAATCLFSWLGLRFSIENDRRIAAGRRPREVTRPEQTRIFVWPDLVYIELIAMLMMTCLLGIWSLAVQAPLEAPADTSWTPNPAKAPWYFVGLQELLVYFEPWFAGVVLPLLIIVGLCLLPYLRREEHHSGYYSMKGRRLSLAVILGGLGLWILLIVIGTFFRGPDWRLYGLYESRLIRRFDDLQTQPLAFKLWPSMFGSKAPTAETAQVPASPILRELPGLFIIFLLFVVIPYIAKRTFGRGLAARLGGCGYWTVAVLLAIMALIPIKMYANWLWNVNYFVHFPELGLSL